VTYCCASVHYSSALVDCFVRIIINICQKKFKTKIKFQFATLHMEMGPACPFSAQRTSQCFTHLQWPQLIQVPYCYFRGNLFHSALPYSKSYKHSELCSNFVIIALQIHQPYQKQKLPIRPLHVHTQPLAPHSEIHVTPFSFNLDSPNATKSGPVTIHFSLISVPFQSHFSPISVPFQSHFSNDTNSSSHNWQLCAMHVMMKRTETQGNAGTQMVWTRIQNHGLRGANTVTGSYQE
jgi:hypothetical protein